MTPAQKANRERFKKVVAEAKKLRKKNPKLSQAQAVKQAWAITYSKGTKVGAAKKAAPKKVAKKAAPKKMAKHIDTKSHNVNIRVVSGINNDLIKELESLNRREAYFNKALQDQLFQQAALKSQSKGKKSGIAKAQLEATKRYITDLKGILKHLKSQKMSVKRKIK